MKPIQSNSFALLLALSLMLGARTVSGVSDYIVRIPNGSVKSCANCHVNGVPPNLNSFGDAFSASLAWSPALASLDSDGDGFTNGQELGDPEGAWTSGAGPIPGAQITLPGVSTSKPTLVAPIVKLTGPTNTASFAAPYLGPVVATLTNVATSIKQVQFYNGATLLGTASNSPYSLPVSLSAGSYTVTAKATDYLGAVGTSTAAAITITNVPPFITVQPTNQTRPSGGTASLSVTATGTAPLHYQWLLNGQPVSGGMGMGMSCSVGFLTGAAAGNYSVIITNAAGSTVSSNAILTVTPPMQARFATPMAMNNRIQMTLNGTTNATYSIVGSTDMMTWTPVTNGIFTNGVFIMNDPMTNDVRFYRAIGQ